MDKPYFIGLLHKYLSGETTPGEEKFIINYYHLFENEPDVLELLPAEKKEALKKEMHTAIWDAISQEQTPAREISPLTKRWAVAAAAAILLIVSSGIIFYSHTGTSPQPAEPVSAAAGQKPQKENHLVALPDGSTVVLSAGSKLDYPSSFEGLAKREVYLTGQAFFDIRRNPAKSFIVHTGKLATTVLGTAFNIKACPGDPEITITVKQGAVKVSDQHQTLGILRPDQQIIYNTQKANSTQKDVMADNFLGWRQENLLFDNLTVEEAARLLEERFNVRISISDPAVGTRRFTTTFPKKESLEEALKSICEFNEAVFSYDRAKGTVTISGK